jgi:RHS repeat-associated protein
MSIHSQLPYDQSTSHARVPAGGIHLIASIDSVSEAQVTASFFGSTKALHGEVAIPSAETSTHNHSNQQYSITAVTTSAGTIAERYAYSAYGEPTILDGSGSQISNSSINNRYSYTGREWDATVGLHHFRARWMSPKTGRFLTRDPMRYYPGMSLYKAYFVPESVDPYGLHDPIFDPFRDKIKKEIARLKGMSTCLLDETGLGNLLSQLELALSRTTFGLSGTQIVGIGGAASATGTYINLSTIDATSVDVMLLIHELVHVHDYLNSINLGGILPPSWHVGGGHSPLYWAENMAYASEYFLNKFEQLSRLESRLATTTEADCDRQQRDFEGAAKIGPGYQIWIQGGEYTPTIGSVVVAS